VAIAQGLAGAICPRERGGKDSYWTESAAGLLTAVLLWLADQPGESKTLARAREIVTAPKKKLDEYLALMAASKAFGGAIAEHAGPFIGLAPETYSGVISNLARHTQFLSDPRVKASTASSTFPMADLAEGTTLYVVIPPERMDSQRTWLRLLITAGMQTFKHVKRRAGHRCMFLVDEFPALGHLEELPRDIATMSGYGVDFTLIVQGLDQLKAVYGDSAETIINNCAYKWFCGVSDLTTSKYLSDTLGQKTVRTISKSASEGKSAPLAGRGARENESESTTWGEMGRKLLTPDEVMNLGRGAAILLHPYTRPHYLKPVDYWRLETAFGMYRQQRLALYWDPPLALDENPYHAAGDAART
jgi:type IV secretory pathway TraG/TraD family ATPase VirD4